MRDRLILALDVDSFKEAKRFLDSLFPLIKIYKIGPQLFIPYGKEIIKFIKKKGAKIFLDLKFFDIPNTVKNACKEVVNLGIEMFSLHIQGGLEMLKEAVRSTEQQAKRKNTKRPFLLGVTVLTSKDERLKVGEISGVVKEAGLDGIICSAKETKLFRKNLGKKFLIVTPGIRPSGFSFQDQKRVSTPKEAILSGADYLVVGRPILEAEDPLKVTKDILKEIYGAERGN